MPLHTYWFFLSSVHVYLILTFAVFNIKILIISFFIIIIIIIIIIYIKKTHELLKSVNLRFRVYNF